MYSGEQEGEPGSVYFHRMDFISVVFFITAVVWKVNVKVDVHDEIRCGYVLDKLQEVWFCLQRNFNNFANKKSIY